MGALLVVAAVAVLGFGGATTNAALSPAVVERIVNYSESDREQWLYRCAQREGRVVVYTSASHARPSLKPAFEAKFPGITVDVFRATDTLVPRLIEEEAAGRHNFDVYDDLYGNLAPTDKHFVKFYSPRRSELQPALNNPYFVAARGFVMSIGYNATIVRANDAPKEWKELLDSKWKGQIFGSADASAPVMLALLKWKFGLDFLRKLAQNARFQQGVSSRGVADLIIAGEVPVGYNVSSSYHKSDYLNRGAPFRWQPMNPMLGYFSTQSISKFAPHPCAAALYIDWLLDRNGGQAIEAGEGRASPFKGASLLPFQLEGFDQAKIRDWVVFITDPRLIQGFKSFEDALNYWNSLFRSIFLGRG